MKKMFGVICLVLCFLFLTNTSEVLAAEECGEENTLAKETDFQNVKKVIRTEMIYDAVNNAGISRSNSYTSIPFEKKVYLRETNANGSNVTLCAVNLYGVFYYYNDGKVHLYSLGTTTYIYENGAEIDALSPYIFNGDGSYSEGSLSFTYTSEEWGLYTCRAMVGFTKDTTAVTSSLDVLFHTLL